MILRLLAVAFRAASVAQSEPERSALASLSDELKELEGSAAR